MLPHWPHGKRDRITNSSDKKIFKQPFKISNKSGIQQIEKYLFKNSKCILVKMAGIRGGYTRNCIIQLPIPKLHVAEVAFWTSRAGHENLQLWSPVCPSSSSVAQRFHSRYVSREWGSAAMNVGFIQSRGWENPGTLLKISEILVANNQGRLISLWEQEKLSSPKYWEKMLNE